MYIYKVNPCVNFFRIFFFLIIQHFLVYLQIEIESKSNLIIQYKIGLAEDINEIKSK